MKLRPPRAALRFGRIALAALLGAGRLAPAPSVAAEAAPQTSTRGVRVWIDVGASALDRQSIRNAIARELRTDVELSETSDTPLRVAYTGDERVQVLYRNEAGEELSRVIDLPHGAERRVEVIALMVGNLTRNEAAELLAALQPKPAEKPPAAPRPLDALPSREPAPAADPELGSGYLYAERPGVNASLYYPVALLPDSDRRVLAIEAGLGYGRVGAIQGIGFAVGALRVEHQVQGLAIAAGATRVDGPLRGVQLAALYNESHGNQVGLNLSGLVTYQRARLTGIGIAGVVNVAEDVDGIAIGGVLGLARSVRGIQLASVASLSSERSEGVQISGVLQSSQESRGFALAGLLNRAAATQGVAISGAVNVTGDLDGVAISVVNVAGRVRGGQVGVVNIATKDVQGYQLGLVNYAHDNGHVQLQAFADTLLPFNAGLKFTTGFGYSEAGFGISGSGNSGQGYLGLGLHFPSGRLSFDVGGRISASTQEDSNSGGPERTDVHYLGQVNVRLVRGIALFGGGGARHGVLGKGAGDSEPEFLAGISLF